MGPIARKWMWESEINKERIGAYKEKRPVRLLWVGTHGLVERDDLLPSSLLLPLESLS